MAFTQLTKNQILFYLGYSAYEDDGPAVRSLNSLDAQDTKQNGSVSALILPIIANLTAIDQQVQKAMPLAMAIEDGSAKVRIHYTLQNLWAMGRQMVARLAAFTKIAVAYDMFSPTMPRKMDGFFSGDPSENRTDSRGVVSLLSGGPPVRPQGRRS